MAKLKIDFQAHSLLTVKDFLTNPIGVPRVSRLQRVSTNDSSMSSWFDGIGVVEASLHDFCKLISSGLRDELLVRLLR